MIVRTAIGAALALCIFHANTARADTDDREFKGYEVWASDQSNSVAGVVGNGLKGSYLWIWDSRDIEAQVAGGPDAEPLGCGRPGNLGAPAPEGPCDLLDVFPQSLREYTAQGQATGNTLADLDGFGRLHGMIADPQGLYVNANIFAPGGGYVGIIDTRRKEAIALFRVTGSNVGSNATARSVHMSFWSDDGSAILIANLNGKILERIDVTRSSSGRITDAALNLSAALGVGKSMVVTAPATVFKGNNQNGRALLGRITGNYDAADLADLTPGGSCKENGCVSGDDGAMGGRPNNLIICPITSDNNNAYVTMAGGGLLVANIEATPMTIVGEYGNQQINGAGCGGIQAGDQMWLNAGVSASGAGATWSTFTVYRLDDTQFGGGAGQPAVELVYADEGNTATGGNASGEAANNSGQLPGQTTRRDSHGMDVTVDGAYMHVVDRIQNVMEVFDTQTLARTTYDLTSADGQGTGEGGCAAYSVSDDFGLPGNDAAPDLMEHTPDGKYMMVAFRGPAPVSVTHAAQGSCPGVGVVELLDNGASGRLVTVLRSTNVVDTSGAVAPGGHPYTGAERSDVHGAVVVPRYRNP